VHKLTESIKDKEYRDIINSFFKDDLLKNRALKSPGSLVSHHAYPGGLIDHLLDSVELGVFVAKKYYSKKFVDFDLLKTGLFLHDIGKMYTYKNNSITKQGYWFGHTILGIELTRKQAKLVKMSKIKKDKLIHIIVSHHYRVDKSRTYDSVKPAFVESVLVNKIESLDASLEQLKHKNTPNRTFSANSNSV